MLKELPIFDKVLVAILLPIWAVCFGLALRSVGNPALIPSIAIKADEAGGYPLVDLVAPWGGGDLRRGDRLIRLGTEDLRGLGPLAYYARFQVQAEHGKSLPAVYERDGQRAETMTPAPMLSLPAAPLLSLGCVFTALVLLLRAPPTQVTRAVSLGFLFWGVASIGVGRGGIALNYVGLAVVSLSSCLSFPLCLRALMLFGRMGPVDSAWARLGPWLFALMGPFAMSAVAGWPLDLRSGGRAFQVGFATYLTTILVMLTRTYRRTDPIGRRQIRWIVLGFYLAFVPTILVDIGSLIDKILFGEYLRVLPSLSVTGTLQALVPLSVLFGILRYNFFDVDRLLSATASYNVVLALLVGFGFVAVPRFGELSSQWLGLDRQTGQIGVALLLAAVVIPAQQRLRPHIDRLFFRERRELELGIAELLAALGRCADARALVERAGTELARLLRPEACVVYAGVASGFEPVFAQGRGLPPAFDAQSPLIATLRERTRPLALGSDGRRPDAAALGPFDRAALEALQAKVVVPVRQGDALAAFLCLGPKRSGDVYTSTDLSLLAAVAEAVSHELRRFDQEQTLRQAREMQESLRRYVPRAVADELSAGAELTPAEREVSVLFVDMRGYTSFAESRRPEEIFSTVNRYTETVSAIVSRLGGSVVEFNGDGMMVVFGAPRELPHKERAAVAAGREIVAAVAALPVADSGGSAQLSVGVGIATGPAFVGSIRAADRLIWSAIGNTTNLAARLQAVTRELDAAVVIDAATWQALGPQDRDFERHETIAIRGRSEPQEVYFLPEACRPRQ